MLVSEDLQSYASNLIYLAGLSWPEEKDTFSSDYRVIERFIDGLSGPEYIHVKSNLSLNRETFKTVSSVVVAAQRGCGPYLEKGTAEEKNIEAREEFLEPEI